MAALGAELDRLRDTMINGFREGQLKTAVKGYYTRDCVIMAPGMDHALHGNENEEWLKLIQTRDPVTRFHRDELIELGDVAIDRGSFQFAKIDGTVTAQGLYVQVWKKEDGNWRVYHVIYTG